MLSNRNNINPEVWGAHVWATMISVALSYPDRPGPNDLISYRQFYNSLALVLPCSSCAKSFAAQLQQYPIDDYLVSRGWLFKWLEIQYNLTAKHTNKPPISFRQMVSKYLGL